MTKYLKISNDMEIEPNAFMLFGACTKRDDSTKIGYFGSGLKYAMAVLLREGVEVEIYSGTKKVELGTQMESLRGQDFKVISINGEKTNLTTDMGIKWKLWQAIREVYCNALDEEGFASEVVADINPTENQTAFYIKVTDNEQLEAILENWDKYFCIKRDIHAACNHGKVMFPLEAEISVYRKGIRCYNQQRKSLFDYDIDSIEITEDRLIKYDFMLYEHLAKIWSLCATEPMIKKLIAICDDSDAETYLEYQISWPYAEPFNPSWLACLKDVIVLPYEYAGHYREMYKDCDTAKLPHKLIKKLIDHFGNEIKCPATMKGSTDDFCITENSERDDFLLNEAQRFFDEVGIVINHPIVIAVFKKKRILGLAKEGKIILSSTVMDRGKRQIVSTIMEECFHLESQMADETRDFQTYLINQMITMLENKHGVFL